MLFSRLFLSFIVVFAMGAQAATVTPQEVREIATEVYLYFYPMISMEISRQQMTNIEPGKVPGFGPMNMFHHMRAFPDAQFRAVVRPNFDTLYSSVWLDVSKEPMLISMPATEGRYYLLPILDMWTDVLAAPGTRTSGTEAQVTAVLPSGWKGKLPKGVQNVVQSTTPYLWLIGRIQTNGPKDYEAVHRIQDQMSVTPLSKWGHKWTPPAFKPNAEVDMKTPPLEQVNSMQAERYFALGAQLLKKNPPHLTDWSQVERFRRIGLKENGKFETSHLSAENRKALEEGATLGLKRMKEKLPTIGAVVNGWSMNTTTMGVYGNDYLKRAIVAMVGLGANQPEDAVYPLALTDKDGKPLTGDKRYVLHFEAAQLPPNWAFWSLTAYDEQGFQIPNELNRFALGDRDALKFNADGSLDIYVQSTPPAADKVSNWLPGPKAGTMGLTLRIYAPKPEVLDGRWSPPAFIRK